MPAHAPPTTDVAAIDAYWRAANYLTVGQIYYLRDTRAAGASP